MGTPADIIDAIDTAINTWVGRPVEIREIGRGVTFHRLSDLLEARTYYAALTNSGAGKRGFKVSLLERGDGR